MQNKKIIILFAVFFSVIFSLIYYFLFTVAFVSPQDKKIVLYMNQVGLYEQYDETFAGGWAGSVCF